MDNSDSKACPYCAEIIKRAAIRCRYCQADLVDMPRENLHVPASTEKKEVNPGAAAFISLIIPGAGFVLAGKFGHFMGTAIVSACLAFVLAWFTFGLAIPGVWIAQAMYTYDAVNDRPGKPGSSFLDKEVSPTVATAVIGAALLIITALFIALKQTLW